MNVCLIDVKSYPAQVAMKQAAAERIKQALLNRLESADEGQAAEIEFLLKRL